MKVIFDARYTRLGRHDGISRYGARLVEELAKIHPDVTMLIWDERQLEMLPDLPWVMGTDPTAASEPWISRKVNPHHPDVVFTPMQTMGPGGRDYALVTTVHDLIYYTHRTPPRDLNPALRLLWRGYHLWSGFQRAVLNRADAHLVDSETTRDLMAKRRMTRNPMHVVLLGTEQHSRPARTAPASKNLVYMGSFMPYKNVDLVVRALHELPGYRLQLMSRITDAERARLTALAPADAVEFFNGATDEQYEDALLGAFALVSASRDEGFGLPVVEAQALGTPALLSDTAIFREIGGEPAGFFDPDSVDSVVTAVRALEADGEWARRSAASVEWARRYNWPDAAKQLLGVLEEAVARRSARR